MPNVPRRNPGPGIHSTRCRTTSRATQPSHGAGCSHASAGTASTRAVKPAATFLKRVAISLIAAVCLTFATARSTLQRVTLEAYRVGDDAAVDDAAAQEAWS